MQPQSTLIPSDYRSFLASKRLTAEPVGFDVDPAALNPMLFPFQRDAVLWALRRGRAALWQECGLGKSAEQLTWAQQVFDHTGGDVLILAPLAVTHQTIREGVKFGVSVTPCRSQADVRAGVNIANYEMLDHLAPSHFAGVVLDESAILRSYMGATKRALIDAFARTPYRLCCTATPAPNDHMELGNHAEFLGIMPSPEMLARWFINDTSTMGTYRLKGYAEAEFWDWIASWALAMRRPSDLGYEDAAFVLPELRLHQVDVAVDLATDRGEHLFRIPDLNATGLHREMRITAPQRAAIVSELVNSDTDTWIVWANTNYEADELTARIPGAVEVRGSESVEAKEQKLLGFLDGKARVLIAKPRMFGYGLNLQFCHKMAYVGLSYSFDALYQSLRRCWRFGQTEAVDAYLVVAETEGEVLARVEEKMLAHDRMLDAMTASSKRLYQTSDLRLSDYRPATPMQLPEWLESVCA